MKRKLPAFRTPEEIQIGLNKLSKEWEQNKHTYSAPKVIDKVFKSITRGIKIINTLIVKEAPYDKIFNHLINLNSDYNLLIKYLKNKKLEYDELVITTVQSEQINLFIEYMNEFTDEQYWSNLAYAYITQNYKKIPYKTYYELFSSPRPMRHKLMSDEEYEFFQQLPDELVIYRGGSVTEKKTKRYGVSWTLNFQKAKEFADVKQLRDKKPMDVFEMRILKSDVIAFFNSRNEDEIIFIYK